MQSPKIESLEPRRLLTVLLFEPATGAFTDGAALQQAYGDRVTAAVQSNFHYGTLGGATPHVVADYGTNGNTVITRRSGFGDLANVASTANHSPFEMTLTADAGYKVSFSGFDLAGAPSHDWTIKSVQVLDGNNNLLYSKTNVLVQGDTLGARHNHISFATPLTASKIKIRFDASNLTGTAAIGMDNVQFGQVQVQGKITGNVFNDVNKDGFKGTGEAGLSGWTVYLDANNDGVFQASEAHVLTDSAGNYSLSAVPGTYHVAEVLPFGWLHTAPTGSYAVTLSAGQTASGKNFGNVRITDPLIAVGNYTASTNSTVTVKVNVSDFGNIVAQDIEGMSFTVQIAGGDGATPSIKSVDLAVGTVWSSHNTGVLIPSGGNQSQFKTFSVITGSDGDYINPNGLLATVILDTTGAAPGTYAIKLVGTKLPSFDTKFDNRFGTAVHTVVANGTLTVK
jgi:hypothetical protein